ncbi:hypothetical protein CEB3_c25560 [Peptococcaceae bacterium CEB3]|nr:hypothetical protein CEB3_c25560 [Peptococcaceae bacterium CEB3]
MTSEHFSVEDIHKIRRDNYEKTKNLSHAELIENTNRRAEAAKKRLLQLKQKKAAE